MGLRKISLMDAYMIETLRSNGVSNQELLEGVRSGNAEKWQQLHDQFDFKGLIKLAKEDMDEFQAILYKGYRVKFVTFNGLQNLIRLRFRKELDKDFDLTETGIQNLKLNMEQFLKLKEMLSGNWAVEQVTAGNDIVANIRLAQV